MELLAQYRNSVINAIAAMIALAAGLGLVSTDTAATPAAVAADYDAVVAAVAVCITVVNAVLHLFPDKADKAQAAKTA